MSQHDVISLVGGGWSFGEVDPNKLPGTIIAVNEAARLLPRYDIAITMDRLWTEHRWDFLRTQRKLFYMRRNAAQNVDWRSFPWAHVFDCDHETYEFGMSTERMNGRNSGYCGLNLAYLLQPRELYLFGFDMQKGPNGEPYWHPPYEWRPLGATSEGKYNDWAQDFAYASRMFATKGTQVVNVSSRTKIKVFARATPEFMMMARNAA